MILIAFSNIDCFEVSSKFRRTIEPSLCFSLRWSQKPKIQLPVWKWKISACFIESQHFGLCSKMADSGGLEIKDRISIGFSTEAFPCIKAVAFTPWNFFFYQPDKDVFFPVAVGVVGQLIELFSAVKLLKKRAGEYLHFFFFACHWKVLMHLKFLSSTNFNSRGVHSDYHSLVKAM